MGTLKSSQVPFAAFCYLRKGKGIGSHREKVGSGERGEVVCPGQTTVVDRKEQEQERSSRRGPI